jgi:hypothetical protein
MSPPMARSLTSSIAPSSPISVTTIVNERSLSAEKQQSDNDKISSVYVHHVSKTVLQHLQQSHAEWLSETGLDQGLRLKSNGTFVLEFPSKRGRHAGRIWTSYDSATKQHWLSVYRGKVIGRFPLKDASISNPQSFVSVCGSEELNEQAVDQMVETLVDLETKREQRF